MYAPEPQMHQGAVYPREFCKTTVGILAEVENVTEDW